MMLLKGEFALREAQARGECVLAVEEAVFVEAKNDAKVGIAFLERRAHKDWAKQVAPAVVVTGTPIKQIVIHASDQMLLEEQNPIDVECSDV
jgi:hypothetical protein